MYSVINHRDLAPFLVRPHYLARSLSSLLVQRKALIQLSIYIEYIFTQIEAHLRFSPPHFLLQLEGDLAVPNGVY